MAIVVAVVLIAGGGGLLIYRNAQQTALANCRSAMTEFSTARKNLLDTTNNASESEQLVRRLLGVDKVMDAFADAMDAAEGTLTDKACAANAMPTQLNIAIDAIRSATDSLNKSVDEINAEINSHAGDDMTALLNLLLPPAPQTAPAQTQIRNPTRNLNRRRRRIGTTAKHSTMHVKILRIR